MQSNMFTRTQKRKNAMAAMSRVLSRVPEDIYHQILLRVPPKSIFVCKCVCKTWLAVISKPDFIKLHLDFTIRSNKCNLLIENNKKTCFKLYSISYDSLPMKKFNVVEFDFTLGHSYTLYCSCNGIVCIYFSGDNRFCLWNPVTMEYKHVPKSSSKYDYTGNNIIALGYDSKNDDYKLVVVMDPEGLGWDDPEDYDWPVEVYSLKMNTWKNIAPIPYNMSLEPVSGVLVNGLLHWLLEKRECSTSVIVTLDVTEERFEDMQLPDEVSDDCIVLGVLEGCLCVVAIVDEVYEIWVMKEYGVQESWERRYVVNCKKLDHDGGRVRLMWSFTNGEILFRRSETSDLAIYDPVSESTRKPSIRGLKIITEENHFESLVSLNTGTYTGTRGRQSKRTKSRRSRTSR